MLMPWVTDFGQWCDLKVDLWFAPWSTDACSCVIWLSYVIIADCSSPPYLTLLIFSLWPKFRERFEHCWIIIAHLICFFSVRYVVHSAICSWTLPCCCSAGLGRTLSRMHLVWEDGFHAPFGPASLCCVKTRLAPPLSCRFLKCHEHMLQDFCGTGLRQENYWKWNSF